MSAYAGGLEGAARGGFDAARGAIGKSIAADLIVESYLDRDAKPLYRVFD